MTHVQVRPLRLNRRNINHKEVVALPPRAGILIVDDVREHVLGRPVGRAHPLNPPSQLETDILTAIAWESTAQRIYRVAVSWAGRVG